jgi:hypothetical protein
METEEKSCRYCLEEGGNLIAPCDCKGTQRWIHRECLDKWRTTVSIYPFADENHFYKCEICHKEFQFEIKEQPISYWHKIYPYLRTFTDFLLFCVLISAIYFGIGSWVVYYNPTFFGDISGQRAVWAYGVFFTHVIIGIIVFILALAGAWGRGGFSCISTGGGGGGEVEAIICILLFVIGLIASIIITVVAFADLFIKRYKKHVSSRDVKYWVVKDISNSQPPVGTQPSSVALQVPTYLDSNSDEIFISTEPRTPPNTPSKDYQELL